MTETTTKKLNNFDEIKECNGTKEISVPTHCCPNGSSTLDALIFRDNGALIFDGNYDLKVEKVYNYKNITQNSTPAPARAQPSPV